MKCREYYSKQALINLRRGYTKIGVTITKFPCAGIVELDRGKCPECGWKPEFDLEGNYLPQYEYKDGRTPVDVFEHNLLLVQQVNKRAMDKKEMKELIERLKLNVNSIVL